MCVGMGAVIKSFRHALSKLSPELSETEAKTVLQSRLVRFTKKRISGARATIVEHVCSAISDGDTVLTFGGSAVVKECLLAAAEHTRFKVVVVDCRPLHSGLATVNELSKHVECVYTPLAGVLSILAAGTVTKVGAIVLLWL